MTTAGRDQIEHCNEFSIISGGASRELLRRDLNQAEPSANLSPLAAAMRTSHENTENLFRHTGR